PKPLRASQFRKYAAVRSIDALNGSRWLPVGLFRNSAGVEGRVGSGADRESPMRPQRGRGKCSGLRILRKTSAIREPDSRILRKFREFSHLIASPGFRVENAQKSRLL